MEFPIEYKWLEAHDFKLLTPWYLISAEESDILGKEYKRETGKEIIPFARRQDRDDVAGFEVKDSIIQSKVITVHLTWAGKREQKGFPVANYSNDLLEWISEVMIPDTRDWMTEGELEDLLKEEDRHILEVSYTLSCS